jgi:acyl-CoA reductase-like NAD-dependent aldehyde dehydrogenase
LAVDLAEEGMRFQPRHLIGGELEGSEALFEVIDPATGRAFASCPDASRAQLDRAVQAARAAFPAWSALDFVERRAALARFAEALRAAADRIAPILTREQGKPLADARNEAIFAAHHIDGLSTLALGDELLRDDGQVRVELRHRPLGVVGGIAPWNFPVVLGMHKVAQALYTGNTLVLKPSPYTPLSTLLIAELAADLFPAGVLNILAGGNDLGRWMTEHPGIDKISFTGSVATGKHVLASASGTLKRVTLELGGNDAAIVLEDADLDLAAAGLFRSAFYNAGQICMAVKRVYVHEAVADALAEKLVALAGAYRVGPGTAEGVQMGPIQNAMQYGKVRALLEDTAARPSAKLLIGGRPLEREGYFIPPTLVEGLTDDAPLVAEEQFGPVLPLLRFRDEEEAVARANATRFGLSASVWTRDVERGAALAGRLEAGSVAVNQHGGNQSDVPFGGAKESGYGREHGVMGLRSYMEPQVITRPSRELSPTA